MMTRRQLRQLAMTFGILLAGIAYCFSTEGMIRWFWGAPIAAAGAVLIAVSLEDRSARKRGRLP